MAVNVGVWERTVSSSILYPLVSKYQKEGLQIHYTVKHWFSIFLNGQYVQFVTGYKAIRVAGGFGKINFLKVFIGDACSV